MRRAVLTLLWFASDAFLFVAAYTLAYFVRVGWVLSTDLPVLTVVSAALLAVPGWLIVMITMRNFALSRQQMSVRSMMYVIYACIIGMALVTLVFYFLEQMVFSRLLLLLGGLLSAIFVILWHGAFDCIQRRILRRTPAVYPTLIIGTNREAKRLIKKLQDNHSPFLPVAVLDGRGSKEKDISGVPVEGKLNVIEQTIAKHGITHLVQCDQLEQSINLLSLCRSHGMTYMLLPFALGVIDDHLPTEALEGQQVIAVDRQPPWKWFFQ